MDEKKLIMVTSPLLPDLDDFHALLKEIWDSRWITNNGRFHQQLEAELASYLKVPYISLFTNGTLPLVTALQALDIKGEVITTPYSFVATTHSLWWNGITPVFADIDPATCNIDPDKIEAAITPRTTAIMPVHCYGTPCDIERIKDIADRHGLRVIYDAAHAFGVKKDGAPVLSAGDMSAISFHATKVYNTIEGGALITHSSEMKQRVDYLKNFGFANEVTVVGPGINSKMDEIRAAYGILNLRQIDQAIARQKEIDGIYREELKDVPGIRLLEIDKRVKHNHSYFPIFIDESRYGMSRDSLYELMQKENIYGRRYFYPLISSFEPYCSLPSASAGNLPNAVRAAETVICLPMHSGLSPADIGRVIDTIKNNALKKQ